MPKRTSVTGSGVFILDNGDDGETVITVSFNFPETAEENNAENLLVIHDKQLADWYIKNWEEHARHFGGLCGKRAISVSL